VVGQYQRLINLSGPDAERARNEIRSMDGWATGAASISTTHTQAVPSQSEDYAEDELPYSLEQFDAQLVSQGRVVYESRGAQIRDARLLNSKKELVNTLQTGRRYIYEYHVDFTRDCVNVAFGMGILTISGFSLGGSNTIFTKERQIREVTAGQVFLVRFEFQCDLLPGSYVINSGVLGTTNDETHYLHRVIDALIFRVVRPDVDTSGGIVDFGIQLSIYSDGKAVQ
jgi:lipopolysaccharide transport system ATP-binding protein